MLSKMAMASNSGGAGGGNGGSGRRAPLSLNSGSTASKQPLENVRSKSPHQQHTAAKKSNPQQVPLGTASLSEDKKGQNGVNKSANGKEKAAHNGSSSNTSTKEQKAKEKQPEKSDRKVENKRDTVQDNSAAVKPKKDSEKQAEKGSATNIIDHDSSDDIIIVEAESVAVTQPSTPTNERKSARNQQKTPNSKQNASPAAKKQTQQPEATQQENVNASPVLKKQIQQPGSSQRENVNGSPAPKKQTQLPELAQPEDVDMEALSVDASPIKTAPNAATMRNTPAATSTPGRISLFGFRSSRKQINEVELAAKPSTSPALAPHRTFAQISGRRSIRPLSSLTPNKLESYRCINSELDTSGCTNASMNATVGSEIPNNSSFSFSFFGRGRKRERTPPQLVGSQSTTELAHDVDVEMSPPKRARFDLFSMNLASPFSLLRSRFSKASISTPSRLSLEQTPPTADEEGEVQNVSGIVIEEEPLNKSTQAAAAAEANNELTVGKEAGLETPKKGGTPVKDAAEQVEGKAADGEAEPTSEGELSADAAGTNRSRCAIM